MLTALVRTVIVEMSFSAHRSALEAPRWASLKVDDVVATPMFDVGERDEGGERAPGGVVKDNAVEVHRTREARLIVDGAVAEWLGEQAPAVSDVDE
jgi:hypothetical protein